MDNETTAIIPAREQLPADPMAGFVASLDSRWRVAKMIVQAGMAPKGMSPQGVMSVMLKAHELGIGPMQALGSVYWFDGRFCLAASLMDGLAVDRCAVRKRLVSLTDDGCTMEFSRPGWDAMEVSYTTDEAKTAGLTGKDNWRKHLRAMLLARCTARGIRLIAPDFFAGTYAVEEFDEAPDTAGRSVHGGGADDLNAALGLNDNAPAVEGEAKAGPEPKPSSSGHSIQALKSKPPTWLCSCGEKFADADAAAFHADEVK